jgi:hypothetical protein
MGSSVSIRQLLSRCGDGDEAAARAVFERYVRRWPRFLLVSRANQDLRPAANVFGLFVFGERFTSALQANLQLVGHDRAP